MTILELAKLTKGQQVDGVVYIQTYDKKTDFTSKAPLYGWLSHKGKQMKFKIWAGGAQDLFNQQDMIGQIVHITGSVTEYKGSMEVTIQTVANAPETIQESEFIRSVDVEQTFNEFAQTLHAFMKPEAVNILATIIGQPHILEKFKRVWAGSRMHDAQVGGTMYHTLKMLRIADTLCKNDNQLEPYRTLLMFSIVCHDLGKVLEQTDDGQYTSIGFVNHRTLGVELLVPFKSMIVNAFDEHFYYCVLSVIQGHHGEFADRPTTVWAYIVHLIDMLESQTTGLMDRLRAGEVTVKNGNSTLWHPDRPLVL